MTTILVLAMVTCGRGTVASVTIDLTSPRAQYAVTEATCARDPVPGSWTCACGRKGCRLAVGIDAYTGGVVSSCGVVP